jgi:hypothetical protein
MSFDLFVFAPALPDDVSARWQQELALTGLMCEFPPGFDARIWPGGMVPIKLELALQSLPVEERHASKPFLAAFGLYVRDFTEARMESKEPDVVSRLRGARKEFFFTTAAKRTIADLRVQWFAASTLTASCDGVLFDPQRPQYVVGRQAIAHASSETASSKFEERLGEIPAFPGWDKIAEQQKLLEERIKKRRERKGHS